MVAGAGCRLQQALLIQKLMPTNRNQSKIRGQEKNVWVAILLFLAWYSVYSSPRTICLNILNKILDFVLLSWCPLAVSIRCHRRTRKRTRPTRTTTSPMSSSWHPPWGDSDPLRWCCDRAIGELPAILICSVLFSIYHCFDICSCFNFVIFCLCWSFSFSSRAAAFMEVIWAPIGPITRWMNVKGMPAGHFVQKDTSFFQFSREET